MVLIFPRRNLGLIQANYQNDLNEYAYEKGTAAKKPYSLIINYVMQIIRRKQFENDETIHQRYP